MKMIYVYGEDFASNEFESIYEETPINSIIQKVEAGKISNEYFKIKVFEFDKVDPKFIEFIRRNIQDYEDSKHHNFYFEDQTI